MMEPCPHCNASYADARPRRQHLLVRSADVLRVLRVSEIDWIEADGHHVRIRALGEVISVRQRLRSFEEALDPVQFLRIHRSTIVNLDRVRELRHWFGGDYQVLLRDGAELRLSRNYRDRLNGYSLEDPPAGTAEADRAPGRGGWKRAASRSARPASRGRDLGRSGGRRLGLTATIPLGGRSFSCPIRPPAHGE